LAEISLALWRSSENVNNETIGGRNKWRNDIGYSRDEVNRMPFFRIVIKSPVAS
jgi:hypothetical protein